MNDCVFCRIIRGELPSEKVYEDDKTQAFLDIHPINPGHCLVIPKVHVAEFQDLEEADYNAVMTTVKHLAMHLKNQLRPQKVGVIIEGFDVPHAHVKVVPLHDIHDISTRRADLDKQPDFDALKAMGARLRGEAG